ncbi:MAG: hybrid sensor histidine kinase/response regulator [Proteobacteria bacterium]|nr:hybrid sensor histidine kinase/response regulator [Pseudomonadota bacterium]
MNDQKADLEKDNANRGTIMVVDDNPNNLDLLEEMLIEAGFKVRLAINGSLALLSIEKLPPNLILLDIQMPGMDGYEVCKQLKARDETKEIPVIFLSALSELSDKVKGFEAGGVDYVTKPFQVEEVLMRVDTHLTIYNLQKKLERQNQELIEAGRFREEVENITRHDLKGPLTPIIGFPKEIRRNDNLSERSTKYLRIIEKSGLRMLTMINRSLDLFKMEKGIYNYPPSPVCIVRIVHDILDEMQPELKAYDLSADVVLNGKPVEAANTFEVQGEEFLCYTMLDNLIRNAIEAGAKGDKITVTLEDNEMNVVRIHNPATVPENIRNRFFEKYATAGKTGGTGLGTYSAMLAAKTQGGRISFQTSEEEGTTVTIHLPKMDSGTENQSKDAV